MPTCKACLGKRQHSVLAHTTSRGDFIGDKEYVYTKQEMKDCSRCNGTGVEKRTIGDEVIQRCILLGMLAGIVLSLVVFISALIYT